MKAQCFSRYVCSWRDGDHILYVCFIIFWLIIVGWGCFNCVVLGRQYIHFTKLLRVPCTFAERATYVYAAGFYSTCNFFLDAHTKRRQVPANATNMASCQFSMAQELSRQSRIAILTLVVVGVKIM